MVNRELMSDLTTQAKSLSNHAGLCDQCKRWAELVISTDLERTRIGNFARVYLHINTHYELRRLFMIKRGIWPSLPAYLKEVSEA